MVSPLSSIVRFVAGNALGVIALGTLIVILDQGGLQSAVWVAVRWLPVSCFYCLVIVGVSRRFVGLQSPLLILVLGFIVALLPFASGFWPLYWWLPQYIALFVAIHLVLLATVSVGWLVAARYVK